MAGYDHVGVNVAHATSSNAYVFPKLKVISMIAYEK